MQNIKPEVAKRTTEHSELLLPGKEDGYLGGSPSVWVVSEASPKSCPKARMHFEVGGEEKKNYS